MTPYNNTSRDTNALCSDIHCKQNTDSKLPTAERMAERRQFRTPTKRGGMQNTPRQVIAIYEAYETLEVVPRQGANEIIK